MDLKSGCDYWRSISRENDPFAPLDRDLKCETAIIGGGIAGALLGYYLVRAGLHVVMLDSRPVGHGSTSASTGLLLYEIDTPLCRLARQIGHEQAARAYRLCYDTLDVFGPLTEELGKNCGLTSRASLQLASRPAHGEELSAEWEARRNCGIAVDLLSKDALRDRFFIRRPAALFSPRALEIDPYRFTRRLVLSSKAKGLEVYCGTRIERFYDRRGRVVLRTSTGYDVTARYVVFATGYEVPDIVSTDRIRFKSTYAVVSEPLANFEGWEERCLIWETGSPYSYLRTTPDNRAMIGGADEDFVNARLRDRLMGRKAELLTARFTELFPRIAFQPSCNWAGTFVETADGLPYIGSTRRFPQALFALGYGGNGITFSLIAAEIIRDVITGKANVNQDLFHLNR